MNGKKAKMMRRVGKVDKRTKRLYNQLSHPEKGLLTDVYQFMEEKEKANSQ